MVGGRFGCSDAEIRRSHDRGKGQGTEQPVRGTDRRRQAESLARRYAVRSRGRFSHDDRGQLVDLDWRINIPKTLTP